MLLLYNTDYPCPSGPTLYRTCDVTGGCGCRETSTLPAVKASVTATIYITLAAPATFTPATPTALLLDIGVILLSSSVIAAIPTFTAATSVTATTSVVAASPATAVTVLTPDNVTAYGDAATVPPPLPPPSAASSRTPPPAPSLVLPPP